MNKTDLVAKVADVVLSKNEARAAVECMLSSIGDALARGETVTLLGFGTFKVAQRKERRGRNPLTGEELRIPARNIPKFVPGKALKAQVR